jgi:hypothetical protein
VDISGNFAIAVHAMMNHVAQAHSYEQQQFGGKFTVGLVVRWNRNDALMWEVLSEKYPDDKNAQDVRVGRRSVQRVARTKNTKEKYLQSFVNEKVRDKSQRTAIRKALQDSKAPQPKSDIFRQAQKIWNIEDEFFAWTSTGPDDPAGGHAEELMLRNWAETYLPENDNQQPEHVEIVLSRSPCLDESSAFVYNEYWPQGCAPKFITAMQLLGHGTTWALAYFELAQPQEKAQLALARLMSAGMDVFRASFD